MSVFRDESGRRGLAVRVASVLGVVSALAALGVFFVSIFPAQWSKRASEAPELAPAARLPLGHALDSRARAPLGCFFVSIFPAQWSKRASEAPELAPAARLPLGHPLESKARERVYRNEQGRLNLLLAEAQAAQKRRKKTDAREPVLAGVAVK